MSDILNQQWTLTKLRTELKEKEERKNFNYKEFRYLAHNCRNWKEVEERRPIFHNKFEVLVNKVMRYRVKEEMKVKRQKKKELQCFRYWKIEFYK